LKLVDIHNKKFGDSRCGPRSASRVSKKVIRSRACLDITTGDKRPLMVAAPFAVQMPYRPSRDREGARSWWQVSQEVLKS
jgi:hypothetical protein